MGGAVGVASLCCRPGGREGACACLPLLRLLWLLSCEPRQAAFLTRLSEMKLFKNEGWKKLKEGLNCIKFASASRLTGSNKMQLEFL